MSKPQLKGRDYQHEWKNKIWIYKFVGTKQHSFEQPVGQAIKGNFKISLNKYKEKYNIPKPMDTAKLTEREVYSN